MIFLVIVRRCQCEVCHGTFDLEADAKPPIQCRLCKSYVWQWGPIHRPSTFIRNGLAKLQRVLDKGSSSLARQNHGRKQWRRFHTKEQEEVLKAKAVEEQALKVDD